MTHEQQETPRFYELWERFQGRGVLALQTNSLGDAIEQFQLAGFVAGEHPKGYLCRAHSLVSQAIVWLMVNENAPALEVLQEAMTLREGSIPAEHSLTGEAMHLMANAYRGLRRFEEADQHYQLAWLCLSKILHDQHDYLQLVITNWHLSNVEWEYAKRRAG